MIRFNDVDLRDCLEKLVLQYDFFKGYLEDFVEDNEQKSYLFDDTTYKLAEKFKPTYERLFALFQDFRRKAFNTRINSPPDQITEVRKCLIKLYSDLNFFKRFIKLNPTYPRICSADNNSRGAELNVPLIDGIRNYLDDFYDLINGLIGEEDDMHPAKKFKVGMSNNPYIL